MNTGNTHRTLTATASGMAASGIMQTLLANATPRIVDELAAPELYGLVAGSYLIASTVTLPLFAQYADRLGPRRIFVIGHLCFVIGTIAMVPAPSMPAFIAARIMQGVGAGAIAPAALASLGLLLDEQARARAFSQLAVAQVVANVLGGPLGGWFTDGPGWRPGLLTVLPLSLTSLLLATSLPTAEAPSQWWRVSLREQFDLWRIRSLRRLAGIAALVGMVSLGLLTYAPLVLQSLHNLKATTAGWLLAPALVGIGLGTAASGRLADRRWTRPVSWALATCCLPLVLLPRLGVVAIALMGAGVGIGITFPLLLLDIQTAAPHDRLAQAGAMAQLGRNAGAGLGVPALSLWLLAWMPTSRALAAVFLTMSLAAVIGLAAALRHRNKESA